MSTEKVHGSPKIKRTLIRSVLFVAYTIFFVFIPILFFLFYLMSYGRELMIPYVGLLPHSDFLSSLSKFYPHDRGKMLSVLGMPFVFVLLFGLANINLKFPNDTINSVTMFFTSVINLIIIRFVEHHFVLGRYLVVSAAISIIVVVGQVVVSSIKKIIFIKVLFALFGLFMCVFLIDLFRAGQSPIESVIIVCSTFVTIFFNVKHLEAAFKTRDLEEYYRQTGRRLNNLD